MIILNLPGRLRFGIIIREGEVYHVRLKEDIFSQTLFRQILFTEGTTSHAGVGINNSGVYQINYMATLYANTGYTGSNYNSIALVSESGPSGTYSVVPYSIVSGNQNQLSGRIQSRLSPGQVLSITNFSNAATYLPSSPVTLSYSTSNYNEVGGTMVFNGLPLYTNVIT